MNFSCWSLSSSSSSSLQELLSNKRPLAHLQKASPRFLFPLWFPMNVLLAKIGWFCVGHCHGDPMHKIWICIIVKAKVTKEFFAVPAHYFHFYRNNKMTFNHDLVILQCYEYSDWTLMISKDFLAANQLQDLVYVTTCSRYSNLKLHIFYLI